MKITVSLTLFFVCLMSLAVSAEAQKTRRTPSRTTAPKTSTIPTLDVRAARVKVSNQQANVNQFINVLGPIALSIEGLDNEAKTRRLSKQSLDVNNANKQKVITAIRNLRAGLVTLETEFRTKSELRKYLVNIQGISDLASQAEDEALAGRFTASKEPLRAISRKLTDTLAVLPAVPL